MLSPIRQSVVCLSFVCR